MRTIDRRQLHLLMKRRQDALILDVRPKDHDASRRLPGAASLPLDGAGFAEDALELAGDPSRPVVVYSDGHGCRRSHRAAIALEQAGFTTVMDYAAGCREWSSAPPNGVDPQGPARRPFPFATNATPTPPHERQPVERRRRALPPTAPRRDVFAPARSLSPWITTTG